MNEVLVIEGTQIERIEYQGQPVLSLPMIDVVHQRPEGTAGRNFRQNREKFIEGVDFYELGYEIWSVLTGRNSSDEGANSSDGKKGKRGYAGSMIFLTLKGYVMLTKSFTDDLSWRIQRILVDSYFRLKDMMKAAEQSLELMRAKDELLDTHRKLVTIYEHKLKARTPLSAEEREIVFRLNEDGVGVNEIARRLGRSKSGISNLLKYGVASGRIIKE